MDPILRQALRKHDGLRRQVETMLLGDDGDIVEAELRNFVAKRPCWTKDDKGKSSTVGTLSATIDLDANPSLPFSGATIEEHKKGGKVTIEKRADGLYIDGHKVVLHLSERQVNGKTIQGHELRRELDGKQVLNAGVLDFLMANQSFVPDEMKKDAKGNTVCTFFWGTIYRDSGGSLCVRDCYWGGGELEQYYSWLAASGPSRTLRRVSPSKSSGLGNLELLVPLNLVLRPTLQDLERWSEDSQAPCNDVARGFSFGKIKNGNRGICGRPRLSAPESSIHTSRISVTKVSDRVAYAETSNKK